MQGRYSAAAGDAMATMRAVRAVIQIGFGQTDADASAMKCRYLDAEAQQALEALGATAPQRPAQDPRVPEKFGRGKQPAECECAE